MLSDICLASMMFGALALLSVYAGPYLKNQLDGAAAFWINTAIAIFLGLLIPAYAISRTVVLVPTDEATKFEPPSSSVKRNYTLVAALVVIFGILGFRGCTLVLRDSFFPAELAELARARETLLPQFRLSLLAYKNEHGCYPEKLHALIPDYIEVLPLELNPNKYWDHRFANISYEQFNRDGECEARFGWLRCSGPDCYSKYEVNKGEFWHDK
ncbi:MAG: hypothetical protein AAF384_05465 [Pseudomonadota bacterium]